MTTSAQPQLSDSVHNTSRSGPWATALVVAAAFLAACGGSSSPAPGDTTAPTLAITSSVATPPARGDVTFTFTFSEDVGTSFTAGDATVTGGTKGTFTKVSATVYTLVVSPDPTFPTGTIAVSVAAGAFTDVASNASTAAATKSVAFDTSYAGFPTISFETTTPATTYTLIGFGGTDGGNSTVAPDPANSANQVAKIVKPDGSQVWAGTTIGTVGIAGAVPTIPITATNTRMSLRVHSPAAGTNIRLKVENAAGSLPTIETDTVTTVANGWETLIFDFADFADGTPAINVTATYNKVSVFPGFGSVPAAGTNELYYVDNLAFVGGGQLPGAAAWADITFEPATGTTYKLTGFGGTDGDNSVLAVDPLSATNHVAKVIKPAGAQTWAGTTVSTGPARSVGKIPFVAGKTSMTVKTYSPAVGVHVRLKVEDPMDATKSVETEALTTMANAWETLTFNFATQATGTAPINLASSYAKTSIFFDFGNSPTAAATYYFDDVKFVP